MLDSTHDRPRGWVDDAVRLIEADARRSADTHLLRYPLPSAWSEGVDVQLYLKDESTHITGSLKHRLARSLFLYGLCNGWIDQHTTVVEASSGSTAVSEAYFAALLGLPFVAVMPASTSPAKVALIESQGGRCHFVEQSSQVYDEAERLARETFPLEIALRLKHMIVSHHGEYDYGSPKLPMTLEAVALHHLDNLDAKCERVSVTELRDNTFYASITVSVNGSEVEIDSRPSDALALAVRVSAPIFAAEEVIEESAIEFEHEVEDTEEVVDKFKEFLDEVTPEDFAQDG